MTPKSSASPLPSPPMLERFDLANRARAAGLHLLLSALVAGLAAALVFGLWYPGVYRSLAGGRGLFLLLIGVDVVLGPLLTFVVFDLKKGWPHLRRDLAVIGLIQLGALGFGLHAVYAARPVATVFEVDRFRVITANQVPVSELAKAPVAYRDLPLTGPWVLGTRTPKAGTERDESLAMGIEGVDIAQRPLFWQPYAASTADALARSRPVALLLSRYPALATQLKDELRKLDVDAGTATFLPVVARGDWVVVLDRAGRLVHYVPVDGFF